MKKFESIYVDGLEAYINDNLVQRPFPIMYEMEAFARENRIPILSPATGSILKLLATQYKSRKILELGTGLGYSTAWLLSSGLQMEIETLDRNLREQKSAETFLRKIQNHDQSIHFLNRHCLEFLTECSILEYDLIFVDCDKICYPEILDHLSKKTPKESIWLFDNVLWHGRLNETIHTKPSDRAIQDFWKTLRNQKHAYTLFPSGDGLLLVNS